MVNQMLVSCKGREYIARDEWWQNSALELEDTGTALNNPRMEFIINNFENFKIKRNASRKQHINTTEILHSLSYEMNKIQLSLEDEQFLEDIMGNDPMCMF